MNSTYAWYSVVSIVLHGSVGIALAAIVAVGWFRQRRLGYLILVAWALVSLFSSVAMMFTGLYLPWMQKIFPTVDRTALVVLPGLIGYLVTSILLGTGLALLIFRKDSVEYPAKSSE